MSLALNTLDALHSQMLKISKCLRFLKNLRLLKIKAPILSFWPKASLVTQSITKNVSSNVKLEKVFYFQNFFSLHQ